MTNKENDILIFLGEYARLPIKGSLGAAGYDIFVSERKVLPPQSQTKCNKKFFILSHSR